MKITDAQVHVWRRVLEPQRQHKPEPIGPDQAIALMDEAGIDRAILVSPSWAADGNEVALDGAQRYPARFRAMGLIDLQAPESQDRIASWNADPAMLGIRISLHGGAPREMFLKGEVDWLWAKAEAARVSVMLYPPGLTKEIGDVARRFPNLRLVIDHLGAALERRPSAVDEAVAQLLDLAPLGNVGVKVSALPWYSAERYPFSDVHEGLRRAVDAFGPHRSFWGTDVTRLPCSYAEARSMMAIALRELGQDDLDLVMGGAISEWLGWPE